jgi:two-component system, OmpR family, alkaline phosphatase synthesis response regulator PhoP
LIVFIRMPSQIIVVRYTCFRIDFIMFTKVYVMSKVDILIADDEPHIIRALSFVFEKEGYALETASNGEEALRKIRDTRPRMVFLDLIMPKMTGDEICRIIKNEEALEGIHVTILTCKGQELDREQSLSNGANGFITKPFSPKEVLAMVKATIGKPSQ